jgi:HEAT repeat protein
VKVDGRWKLIDRRSLRNIGPPASAIPVLIAALKDDHEAVRHFAAKRLSGVGSSALVALAEALKDKNEYVRTAAPKIIGDIGLKAEPVIPALVSVLKSEDEIASSNAAQALVRIGPAVIPFFIEALKDQRDHVRRNAARGIDNWYSKDEDARDDYARRHNAPSPPRQNQTTIISVMIEALKDSDAKVKQSAAGTLQIINPQTHEAAEALLAALRDPDKATSSSAGNAIVSIVLSSPMNAPFKQTAISGLIAALRGEDKVARDIAASLLLDRVGRSIGSREKEVVPALIDALKDSTDTSARIRAFQRLALLGREGKVALPAVLEALKDPDAGVRKAAADALAAIAP